MLRTMPPTPYAYGFSGLPGVKLHAAGFTLLDLIATISILMILSVAAVVKFDLAGRDVDAVARALRSNLQFAQDLAMTHGNTYGFRPLSATTYEIYEGSPGTPARNPLTNGSFTVDISPVQFAGPVPEIPFSRSGSPNIGADVQIGISSGGAARTVTVARNTGFVALGP